MMDGLTTWMVVWFVDTVVCPTLNHVYSKKGDQFLSITLPYYLAALGMLSPLVLFADDALFRAILSLASVFYFCKVREVLYEPRFAQETLFTKCCSVGIMFFDLSERQIAMETTGRAWRILKRAAHLGANIAAQMACAQAFESRHLVFPHNEFLRTQFACIVGCLYFFFGLHVYSCALQLNLLLIMPEYDFPGLMNAPHTADSVRQFWKRWDLAIQALLFKYVYKSAKQAFKSSEVAIALTFLASGAVHVWPILAASLSNWPAALEMFSYFVYQLGAIALETFVFQQSAFAWAKQRAPWIGKLWTILHLFGPSYLLIHPVMVLAKQAF